MKIEKVKHQPNKHTLNHFISQEIMVKRRTFAPQRLRTRKYLSINLSRDPR